MRQAPIVALLLLSAAACSRAAPRIVAERPPVIAGMVVKHCSDCHSRSVSDALPEALRVFDLDDPSWLAGIPSKSFYAFTARLLPFADSKMARELRVTVDAELARRRREIKPLIEN